MNFGCLFARHIHPEIAGLAHYALELAGDNALPPRSRFDPDHLGAIRDYIYLVEILRQENDYYFSLSGQRMEILFGTNLGGRHLSELGDCDLRHSLRKTYDRVVETGRPLFMHAKYTWPGWKSLPIQRLLVPFAADDGQLNAICGISVPEIADVDVEMYAGHGPALLVREDELLLTAC